MDHAPPVLESNQILLSMQQQQEMPNSRVTYDNAPLHTTHLEKTTIKESPLSTEAAAGDRNASSWNPAKRLESTEDDSVSGTWSTDGEESEASRRRQNPLAPSNVEDDDDSTTSSGRIRSLTKKDLEICQRLDWEYEHALEERDVAFQARYNSVRQSACFSVGFMGLFLCLGTIFFVRQAEWTISESLLFSIYTITTVGYGHLETPDTASFQLYTIFYIFIGIATLTIMVAQVYQCISLEASRAQYEREMSVLVRATPRAFTWAKSQLPRNDPHAVDPNSIHSGGASSHNNELVEIPSTSAHFLDHAIIWFEKIRIFFRENEIGRGLSVLFPFAGLILIGAIVIGPLEGWGPIEALYFSVVSLTTVGFGDYYPTSTAGIIFCILWLPFSIGFMSLFLTNVAAFYIRLSDSNVERIERHLRRKIRQAKEEADAEKDAARRRALRGQGGLVPSQTVSSEHEYWEMKNDGTIAPSTDYSESEPGDHSETLPSGQSLFRGNGKMGFDTVPMENPEALTKSESNRRTPRKLFGTEGSASNRREKILANSRLGDEEVKKHSAMGGTEPTGSSMTSMKEILRTVHSSMSSTSNGSREQFLSGPESEFLSIRSSRTIKNFSSHKASLRKPSFALRALVQERFAEIIACEIAGYQNNIHITENKLSVTIDSLRRTADKWHVPRRARRAFRAVAFEALFFVGEHGLITRGANALFDLTPVEFHGLFAPLLAALGDAETMEAWLERTAVLAEVDLK